MVLPVRVAFIEPETTMLLPSVIMSFETKQESSVIVFLT